MILLNLWTWIKRHEVKSWKNERGHDTNNFIQEFWKVWWKIPSWSYYMYNVHSEYIFDGYIFGYLAIIHLWYCINIESSHIFLYNIKILVALLGLEYLQAFWGLICFNIPMQGCQYELKIGSAKWDWSRWAEIPGYVRIFSRNLPLTFFTKSIVSTFI